MNFTHAPYDYSSTVFRDDIGGCIGVELSRRCENQDTKLVARLTYWDAAGDYALEMFVPELPLGVIERLVNETRKVVGIH